MRFIIALFFMALAGGIAYAAEAPKIPGIMLPELTKVTPEMIARITAACPGEPAAKPVKPRKILIFSRCENFTHHSISVAEKALAILGEKTGAWSADISYDYGVFDTAKLAVLPWPQPRRQIRRQGTSENLAGGRPRQALAVRRAGQGLLDGLRQRRHDLHHRRRGRQDDALRPRHERQA